MKKWLAGLALAATTLGSGRALSDEAKPASYRTPMTFTYNTPDQGVASGGRDVGQDTYTVQGFGHAGEKEFRAAAVTEKGDAHAGWNIVGLPDSEGALKGDALWSLADREPERFARYRKEGLEPYRVFAGDVLVEPKELQKQDEVIAILADPGRKRADLLLLRDGKVLFEFAFPGRLAYYYDWEKMDKSYALLESGDKRQVLVGGRLADNRACVVELLDPAKLVGKDITLDSPEVGGAALRVYTFPALEMVKGIKYTTKTVRYFPDVVRLDFAEGESNGKKVQFMKAWLEDDRIYSFEGFKPFEFDLGGKFFQQFLAAYGRRPEEKDTKPLARVTEVRPKK